MKIKKFFQQRIYILPVFLLLLAIAGYQFDKELNSHIIGEEKFTIEKTFLWKADSVKSITTFAIGK